MAKPKVFVSRIIPAAGLDKIKAECDVDLWTEQMPPPYEVLTERVQGVDGLLCLLTDRIDPALMDAAGPQLKVISQMAVGYDNIDIPAAAERNIPVGNTPGVLTEATADLTFALLLAAARRIVEGVQYIKDGKWKTWEPETLLGADLSGATLGIVGLGRIGKAVAQRASGFEMNLIAYDRSATAEQAAELGIRLVEFDELLAESDFVSLHTPLTEETRHLMNAETLGKMKSTAVLVNTARGPIVDPDALYDALKDGTIAYAALDVTEPEPIAPDHRLLSLPNLTVVPHIGSASVRTRNRMAEIAADNLLAGLRGDPLPHQVKP
ncbi:MAG: D-glycerate dehydrogenase [Anaerolineaceae bacterium]|nr:D-glycerate dehydrogenase [Anaerolineaceae bacterium]